VTVNGTPNRRACMTPVDPGNGGQTQVALPDFGLGSAVPQPAPPRVIAPDVLILGGGAGGLSAAIAARAAGASVVVLDERKVGRRAVLQAGGRCVRARRAAGGGCRACGRVRARAGPRSSGVEVWGAFDAADGGLFLAEHRGAALVARPKTLIVATGAYERPEIVPGWTLPGVMTTGAAQTLWRSYRTLPGRASRSAGRGRSTCRSPWNWLKAAQKSRFVAERRASADHAAGGGGLALPCPGRAHLERRADAARAEGARRAGPEPDGAPRLGSRRARRCSPRTFDHATGRRRTVTVDAVCMNAGSSRRTRSCASSARDATTTRPQGHLRCGARRDCARRRCPASGPSATARAGRRARRAGRGADRGARGGGAGRARRRLRHLRRPAGAVARHRRFQRRLWRLHDIAPKGCPRPARRDDHLPLRGADRGAAQGPRGLVRRAGPCGDAEARDARRHGPLPGPLLRPGGRAAGVGSDGQATGGPISFFAPRVPVKPVAIGAILAAQEALDAAP
jgi:D-hydroxyproline dehydrogenase subunit alpha